MAFTITHSTVSGAAANPNYDVDGPAWDANHTITGSIAASEVTSGAELSKTDDTNVTLTLGGTPTTALLKATSLTLGWTGTLAVSRGGTGISSFGTGVATFLGTPSSANLATAVTDETGSGALVFANTPTLVTPLLGTPTSGTLTNCTGLPISTGITGTGTGVLTALAINVGSSGAFVTFDGALGTPSSGTLTNATGLPLSTGITGAGTGVLTALAVNVGSAGAVIVNGGALGTPSSGTLTNCTGLPVAGGGTGLASATAYAVLCGGTTSTGAFQSIASVGTSGQVLTSNGAGALPTFQTVASSGGSPVAPQGRLTLTSATAITTADVTAATSIYFTPFGGTTVPIYDGSSTANTSFTELTLALDNNSGHTNYHQSGKNYDLFVVSDSGTIRLGTGPKWDDGAVAGSDTARGTGAGSTEIELKNGFWTNKNTITIRYGSLSGDTVSVSANRATFVGSFRATADGQATDSYAKRLLSNAYNRTRRMLLRRDTTDSWSWSTGSYHQVNASASNQIETIACLTGFGIFLHHKSIPLNDTSTLKIVYSGIGINSSSTQGMTIGAFARIGDTTVVSQSPEADYTGFAPLGYTTWYMLEKGAGSGTQTWFGDGGATDYQSGMSGDIWM